MPFPVRTGSIIDTDTSKLISLLPVAGGGSSALLFSAPGPCIYSALLISWEKILRHTLNPPRLASFVYLSLSLGMDPSGELVIPPIQGTTAYTLFGLCGACLYVYQCNTILCHR